MALPMCPLPGALARGMPWDPRRPWHAAAVPGGQVRAPQQYRRAPEAGEVFSGAAFGMRWEQGVSGASPAPPSADRAGLAMGVSMSGFHAVLRVTAAAALAALALDAGAEQAAGIAIDIARDGDAYIVDALLFAPVTRREAWEVLTDFDRMGGFVPNLSESRVVRRAGEQLTIAQKGVARLGVLSFPFESVREVELQPYHSIRSRNIGGNIRRLDSLTRFSDADGGTRISYRVEVIPGFWFPGLIGEAFLRHELAEQFEAIVREMLGRRGRPGG